MRKLTKQEEQFVKEAEEGCFTVSYEDNGTPYAMGAPSTGNLFSMDVDEHPTADGAVYTLHAEHRAQPRRERNQTMSTTKTNENPNLPLADATGSAVPCEWILEEVWTGTEYGRKVCQKPATWKAPCIMDDWIHKEWNLCDEHKALAAGIVQRLDMSPEIKARLASGWVRQNTKLRDGQP